MEPVEEPSRDQHPESREPVVEPSRGPRKRGRPPNQLPTDVEKNNRKKKRDKDYRDDMKAIVEELGKSAPPIKQVLELAGSDSIREFHQNATYIESAIVRFKEVAPFLLQLVESVGQANSVELQQNEGQNVRHSAQEIKDAIKGVSEATSLLNEMRNLMQSNHQELEAEMKGVSEAVERLRNEVHADMHSNRQLMESNRQLMESNQQSMHSNEELKARIDSYRGGLREIAPFSPGPETLFSPNNVNFGQPSWPDEQKISNWQSLLNIDGHENGINGDMATDPPSCSPNVISIVEESVNNPTRSDENGEGYDDEQVKTFFEQFDGNTKGQIEFSDFIGLEEELKYVKQGDIPPFLKPTEEKIKAAYDDITENSILGNCANYAIRIMLYATIKEIDELKDLKDVSVPRLKVWRDAITGAEKIDFTVPFAKSQVKRIARAYFGSKAMDPNLYKHKERLEGELEEITKKIQLREECQAEATYFNDKPLNTGLFAYEMEG